MTAWPHSTATSGVLKNFLEQPLDSRFMYQTRDCQARSCAEYRSGRSLIFLKAEVKGKHPNEGQTAKDLKMANGPIRRVRVRKVKGD